MTKVHDVINDAHEAAALALRAAGSSGLPVPDAIGVKAILNRWAYRVTDDGPVREYTVRDVKAACHVRGLPLADAS